MKKFLNLFLSSKATMILLFLSGIAMACATFIEDKYDTLTARNWVYNTTWFEILFLLLIINLFGHIKTYNLLSRKKIGGLMFHTAFIVMILGAAITRYFGEEGSMHIRKGESSNIIYTSDPYLMISYTDKDKTYNYDYPVAIADLSKNSFSTNIPATDKGKIEIKLNEFVSNAVEKIEENVSGGLDLLSFTVASPGGMQNVIIKNGEVSNLGEVKIAFNADREDAVKITENNGVVSISSPYDFVQSNMNRTEVDSLSKDSITELKKSYIYNVNGQSFMYSGFYKSAVKKLVPGNDMENRGFDAMVLDVIIGGKTYKANVFNTSGYEAESEEFNFDGTKIKIAYGNKPIELPFSIYLKDFIFEKYPGSESPSSYKSEVTLIDERNSLKEDHSIYMNNVLDYNKYRFFQSSYDTDEQGTILSVSHDFWGTYVSYFGYFLLMLGFIITLFNKNSRFQALRKYTNEVRIKRKSILMTFVLFLGISSSLFSQNQSINKVDAAHAEKFGNLLTQTFDGRFAPVNTLAIDLIHKVSKKGSLNVDGKGKMDAVQILIDMMAEPDFWRQQKIIYIPQKGIREILGINTEYAAFIDFFGQNSEYKLDSYISEAFRKKQNEKNKFDKEILKVDERLNIFHMITTGTILKIFPEQDSKNHKWISWDDKASTIPLTGAVSVINEDLNLKVFNYANLMQAYMYEVLNAMKSGDYSKADKIITHISNLQKQFSDPTILPSESKINAEVFYNEYDIFTFLKFVYMVLSVILLVLAFTENMISQKKKWLSLSLNGLTIVLIFAFIYHTIGMGLRWYITGHAPWANGYETLVFVSWGSLVAGFSFARNSKITLAATTLFAGLVLMVAGLSSYDPQLTNLQPVLKSYWLIIHVATLAISYCFLGLGFILGLMNLVLFLLKTSKNHKRFDLLIDEHSYIIEMNLIIGLILATIGTFLGAVWANESWGRYWGWDAKETWALIIVITYSIVIHMRFIPKFNSKYAFNVASVLGFSSVLMTFVGVNYYLSKGMHSYGAGDTPIFPLWAWGTIFAIIILIISAGMKEKNRKLN